MFRFRSSCRLYELLLLFVIRRHPGIQTPNPHAIPKCRVLNVDCPQTKESFLLFLAVILFIAHNSLPQWLLAARQPRSDNGSPRVGIFKRVKLQGRWCGVEGSAKNVLSIGTAGRACEPFNSLNVLWGQVGLEGSGPETRLIVSVLRESVPQGFYMNYVWIKSP